MNKIDWWNVVFSLFFLLSVCVGYWLVAQSLGGLPRYIALGDAALLTLATFRLTRLAVYDNITEWFRDLFSGGAPRTFVGTVHTLVHCPWCVALWFGLVTSVVFFAWPQFWLLLFVLAISGVASLAQIFANLMSWHAEFKKRATIGTTGTGSTGGTCG